MVTKSVLRTEQLSHLVVMNKHLKDISSCSVNVVSYELTHGMIMLLYRGTAPGPMNKFT